MKKKQHKKNKQDYIKVHRDLLKEMLHLLAEAEDHLDYDFDYGKSDEYLHKIRKIIDKANDLAYPVRPY